MNQWVHTRETYVVLLVICAVWVWSGWRINMLKWNWQYTHSLGSLPAGSELALSGARLWDLQSSWQLDGPVSQSAPLRLCVLPGLLSLGDGCLDASPVWNLAGVRTSWEAGLYRILASCQVWLMQWFQYELIRLFRNGEKAQYMLFMAITRLQLETKYSMFQSQI